MKRVILTTLCLILLAFGVTTPADEPTESLKDGVKFTDVQKQTVEFIGYYRSIQLTPDQDKVKNDVLSSIPAACCSDFTAATCCCPCNQSKSVWGLSNYLIAKKNFNADQVREAVLDWTRFLHDGPPPGDSCHAGRCMRPFTQDGCGGMKDDQVVF